jgi:hypothetical protein
MFAIGLSHPSISDLECAALLGDPASSWEVSTLQAWANHHYGRVFTVDIGKVFKCNTCVVPGAANFKLKVGCHFYEEIPEREAKELQKTHKLAEKHKHLYRLGSAEWSTVTCTK